QRISHVGSWEWDVLDNRIAWSDEMYAIFGSTPNAFAATYDAYLERVHPDDRQRVAGRIQEAAIVGVFAPFDHRIVRPDQSVRWLHCEGYVQRTGGVTTKMVGVSQDVTAQREAERRRAELDSRFRNILEASPVGFSISRVAD